MILQEYIDNNNCEGKYHIVAWDPYKRRYPEGMTCEGVLREICPKRYLDKRIRKVISSEDGWRIIELFI